MIRPDFFIVGAPKCGTTAMYNYLRQHPSIFMPFMKEPLYFGSDLTHRYGRMSPGEYLALFEDAAQGQRVGEASAWYLYSHHAATEIKAFSPQAQIIVMLRNPIDVMYAQHSQLIFNRQETIRDFKDALEAEPERRRGRHLPPGPIRVENLFYRALVRFADQLERYLAVFGRARVHVIVHDDMRASLPEVYRDTLRFLGVDDTFVPDLRPANENRQLRSTALQSMIFSPPVAVRRLIPRLRRHPLVHKIRATALRLNSHAEARPPLDPVLRKTLLDEIAPEVGRLGDLIGRDLSQWLIPDGGESKQ